MTSFGIISIFIILCAISVFSLGIDDFSTFFSSLFNVTKDSEVTETYNVVDNVVADDIKKLYDSEGVESKPEISNKQRLFNWSILIAFILLILCGIIFFTGSSGIENVDSSASAEAISNSGGVDIPYDSSNSHDSYDSDISNEAAMWYDELPEGEVAPKSAETKMLDVFLEEESLD